MSEARENISADQLVFFMSKDTASPEKLCFLLKIEKKWTNYYSTEHFF